MRLSYYATIISLLATYTLSRRAKDNSKSKQELETANIESDERHIKIPEIQYLNNLLFSCHEPLDLVAIVDNSSDITKSELLASGVILKYLSRNINLHRTGSHISIILGSNPTYPLVSLDSLEGQSDILLASKLLLMLPSRGPMKFRESIAAVTDQLDNHSRRNSCRSLLWITGPNTATTDNVGDILPNLITYSDLIRTAVGWRATTDDNKMALGDFTGCINCPHTQIINYVNDDCYYSMLSSLLSVLCSSPNDTEPTDPDYTLVTFELEDMLVTDLNLPDFIDDFTSFLAVETALDIDQFEILDITDTGYTPLSTASTRQLTMNKTMTQKKILKSGNNLDMHMTMKDNKLSSKKDRKIFKVASKLERDMAKSDTALSRKIKAKYGNLPKVKELGPYTLDKMSRLPQNNAFSNMTVRQVIGNRKSI